MSIVAFYRHEFKQGAAYSVDIDLTDSNGAIDTTGWTGIAPIVTLDGATPQDGTGSPIAFEVTFPLSGTARLSLTPVLTAALQPKRYLSDAKFSDASSNPAYYLDGDVLVRRSYP